MNKLSEVLFYIAIIFTWLLGIVIAKGITSTLFSIFVPPYAWYLVVEKVATVYGLV